VSAVAALMLLLVWTVACGRKDDDSQVLAIDLLRTFPEAEKRPADGAFAVREHTFREQSRASLIVPPNSRIIWTTWLPHRSTLELHAAVPDGQGPASVEFRLGISDDRVYNMLSETVISSADTISTGWIPVTANLSLYAGRKMSLFYRPDERRWRIVVGTRAISGAPSHVYLGEPGIRTDNEAARAYVTRMRAAVR
jgi:hypothetical protein